MDLPGDFKKVNVFPAVLYHAMLLFAVLFIFTVPYSFPFIPSTPRFLLSFFEKIYHWAGVHMFGISRTFNAAPESDSAGLYLHVFFLLSLSLSVNIFYRGIKKKSLFSKRVTAFILSFIAFYLALQLFTYGFNKLFKVQFYLPEPNTLYTTLGNTPRDLLYWSTMGVSRLYNIFTGAAEILAAILLLFRRTRLAGALTASFILLNVLGVNFAYDISVKILSAFLLLLSLLIACPQAGSLFALFFKKQEGGEHVSKKSAILKILLIIFLLFSTLYPYISTKNFNDDAMPRPAFHGAYDATLFVRNGDAIAPLLSDTIRWRRAFIHRQNYFIIQKMNDEMIDYGLVTDTVHRELILFDQYGPGKYSFHYTVSGRAQLKLEGVFQNDSLSVILDKIDLKQLPLLQDEFHWTSDE